MVRYKNLKINHWTGITYISIIVGLGIGCQQETPKIVNVENPVKIGILAPYQGSGYRFLTDLHRGLDLAFSDAGDFHLIYENSDTSTFYGKGAIDKLIRKDKVLAIFGGDDLDLIKKTAEASAKNHILYFPSLLTLPEETAQLPYVFSNAPTTEKLVEVIVEFCLKKSIKKNIFIIYQEDSYHKYLLEVLRDSFSTHGLKIGHSEDIHSSLNAGDLESSDLVMLLTNYDYTIQVLNNLKVNNFEGTVIGSILAIRHPIDQEIDYPNFYYPRLSFRERSRYYRKFKKDFGAFHKKITPRFPELFEEEPNHFESQSYEAAEMLIEALLRVGTNPNNVQTYLLSSRFRSMTGPLHFNQLGQVDRTFEIVRLDQAKPLPK